VNFELDVVNSWLQFCRVPVQDFQKTAIKQFRKLRSADATAAR
jgi:hypothetical protein